MLKAKEKALASARTVMINYRVDDFDGFIAQLKQRGVTIDDVADDATGRFCHLKDPEGNPIELWAEPTGERKA